MTMKQFPLVAKRQLPEGKDWLDEGCEVHPACLSCPLERCRYDEPLGLVTIREADHRAQVQQYRREGLTFTAIVTLTGISRRTVYRHAKSA